MMTPTGDTVATPGQKVSVAADCASNGRVESKDQSQSRWHQTDLTKAASAPEAKGIPACFTWSYNKTMHVFYRGKDNDIHELWYDGRWHHNNLRTIAKGPPADSDPSAYDWPVDSSMHVVYRGTDNHIHEYWFKNGRWGRVNLTSTASAPLADSAPFGYVRDHDHTMNVIYRCAHSRLYELQFERGRDWTHTDLTSPSGAPLALGPVSGYNFNFNGTVTKHVTYVGHDHNVHELWRPIHGDWGYTNISSSTGASRCAWSTCGYVWEYNKTQHVVYRGLDTQQIHEFWWDGSWHHTNVSEAAGGSPIAQSDPTGFTCAADKSMHIVYGDRDGRVHELCFQDGAWSYNDLVELAGVTRMAADQPVGFVRADRSLHVVYCGHDGHLQELYRYL